MAAHGSGAGAVPRWRLAPSAAVLFRRRALPPELEAPHAAFAGQVRRVEEARDALMSCLPVGRVDPVPVPVGLDLLEDVLREVAAELAAWRVADVEDEWQGCRAAIGESIAHLPRAREVAATSTELEELLGAVEDVDEPLGHAFGRAAERWRRLRR
jgi:hypothetical protein